MIRVIGTLHCPDAETRAAVLAHLAAHVAQSRAEPGCLHFAIAPTADPLVFDVDESYRDADAFAAHKARTAASAWAAATRAARRALEVRDAT